MQKTVTELNEMYQTLHHVSGRRRVTAFKAYCQTVIALQERGELGVLPAASYIEGGLAYSELKENLGTARILEKASALLSPLRSLPSDSNTGWRDLVQQVLSMQN